MPLDANAIDPVDLHVGRQIREARAAAGVTQAQLGDAIGVTFQQVQKYERGTNRISASMIVRVSHALDTPLTSLFPGQDGSDGAGALAAVRGGRTLAQLYAAMTGPQRAAIVAIASELARCATPTAAKITDRAEGEIRGGGGGL